MKFRSNTTTKGFNIHFDDTNANEKLKIQLDESGTTTDFMTLVGADGNVGIGTSSPIGKLQISTEDAIDCADSANFDKYHLIMSKTNPTANGTEIGLCFWISNDPHHTTQQQIEVPEQLLHMKERILGVRGNFILKRNNLPVKMLIVLQL